MPNPHLCPVNYDGVPISDSPVSGYADMHLVRLAAARVREVALETF